MTSLFFVNYPLSFFLFSKCFSLFLFFVLLCFYFENQIKKIRIPIFELFELLKNIRLKSKKEEFFNYQTIFLKAKKQAKYKSKDVSMWNQSEKYFVLLFRTMSVIFVFAVRGFVTGSFQAAYVYTPEVG